MKIYNQVVIALSRTYHKPIRKRANVLDPLVARIILTHELINILANIPRNILENILENIHLLLELSHANDIDPPPVVPTNVAESPV